MTQYSTRDESYQDGSPIELYTFTRNSVEYKFTSSAIEVHNHQPEIINRSDISQTSDVYKSDITITIPISNLFAATLSASAMDTATLVSIKRGHYGDGLSDYVSYWQGRVVSVKTGKFEVSLSCESIFSALRRDGLTARYTVNCRHPLYGLGCGLDKSLFALSTTAQSVSSNGLVVTPANMGGAVAGYYAGGMMQIPSLSVYAAIESNTTSTVTLTRRVAGLTASTPIILHPGCDHTTATCNAKFGNILNFGGFPWIPTSNLYDGSVF